MASDYATDPAAPSLALLMKIGSIVVHTAEMLDEKVPTARAFDEGTLRASLADPEVRQWIEDMGVLLPRRRDA